MITTSAPTPTTMENTLKPATLAALPLDLACRLAAANLTHEQWLVVGFLCLQVGVRTSIAAALFGSDGSKAGDKLARKKLRDALTLRGLYEHPKKSKPGPKRAALNAQNAAKAQNAR